MVRFDDQDLRAFMISRRSGVKGQLKCDGDGMIQSGMADGAIDLDHASILKLTSADMKFYEFQLYISWE